MKLLFNYNGKPEETTHRHSMIVSFPKSNSGFKLQGETCKTIPEWLESLRRTLLAIGISDFQYSYPPSQPHSLFKINFNFKEEIDLLRFIAIAFGDSKGIFSRVIMSQSSAKTDIKLNSVISFVAENEIEHQIIRVGSYDFKIVTYSRYNDLAIATHFTKNSFENSDSKLRIANIARLLTSNP